MSQSEILPYSQELNISHPAHRALHFAMLDAANVAFTVPSSEKEWSIVGLPIGTDALAGEPGRKNALMPYSFMNVTVGQEHGSADYSLDLHFHGHPREHKYSAKMNEEGNFLLTFDNAGDRRGDLANPEDFTHPRKHEMFAYLFSLLGETDIPDSVHHPDKPDFDTNIAIEALLGELFANQYASSSTLTERRKHFDPLISQLNHEMFLSSVQVDFVRSTTFANDRIDQSLELACIEGVNIHKIQLEKKLVYSFPLGEGPDSDATSARLELTTQSDLEEVDQEALRVTIKHTEETLSRDFLAQMRRALATMSQRAADSIIAD